MKNDLVCKSVLFVLTVGALAWGALALKFDVWSLPLFTVHAPWLARALQGVVGLCGLMGLWCFIVGCCKSHGQCQP